MALSPHSKWIEDFLLYARVGSTIASYPGPFGKGPGNTVIPLCAMTFTCTLLYIYLYTADNLYARPGFCRVVCLTVT